MDNKIRIVYVDDKPDSDISRYLAEKYQHAIYSKEYNEIRFKSEDGYESLLNNSVVKEGNIILIDSKLFENESAVKGKFSGEEFKIILRKMLPFIEVIVITQNEVDHSIYGTIQKYRSGSGVTPHEYYESKLKIVLDEAIQNISNYRQIANKLNRNEGIDKVLVEKIMSSLDGISQYDELTTLDINEIISAFKELQRDVYGE
ncbi:hypothetical protein COLU111180_13590 [Cohnella lubricantis]|uniref:Uncharacterized protein n=1 Tax=Cohnella lubricantis TaxID=2163172 RepID=A0A841T7E9_9BACL|nr:hypothetical protein [Cohnella lubricantis]MBB6675875.1 hypothetical protein [Cohnella lubricantis]MBP2117209.1 putative transposase YbfD/YdcC [Cohnella lubricantis]